MSSRKLSLVLPLVALIMFVVVLAITLLYFNGSPELVLRSAGEDVALIRADGQTEPLPTSQELALAEGQGVQVGPAGWASLSLGDALRAEIYPNSSLAAVSLDPATASINLRHRAGTILAAFEAGQSEIQRLLIETEPGRGDGGPARLVTLTATGGRFVITEEPETGLLWIIALEAADQGLTLEIEDGTQAWPLTSGQARWVAPVGQPSQAIAIAPPRIEQWLAGLRAGLSQPPLGDLIWSPAIDQVNGWDFRRLERDSLPHGQPLAIPLRGEQGAVELTLTASDEAAERGVAVPLEDCNDDRLLDIPLKNNDTLLIDFRPTQARVRDLELTVLNRAGPGSGSLRTFDPAFEQLPFPGEAITVGPGEIQTFSPSTNLLYHYAQLRMQDGCLLSFKLLPSAVAAPVTTPPMAEPGVASPTARPTPSPSPATTAVPATAPTVTLTPSLTPTATAVAMPTVTPTPTPRRTRTPTATPDTVSPRLLRCSPSSGQAVESVTLICSGRNFRPNRSGFRVELIGTDRSTELEVEGGTSTTFQAIVPPGLPDGPYDLLVANPDSRSDIALAIYRVVETTPTPPPRVAFLGTRYTAIEGDGQASVAVILSDASAEEISVEYSTAEGTASRGDDYQSAGGSLVFAPGQTRQSFEVELLDDELDEANETIDLRLSNPANASLGLPDQATLTIFDNDASPSVRFSADTFTVNEGGEAATIEVTLTDPSGREVIVDYATADGTATAGQDYVASSGSLIFPPGETSQTFQVPLLDDELTEPAETVTLSLSNPLNAELGSPDVASLTITDDDEVPTLRFSSESYTAEEGTGPVTIQVVLSRPTDQAVTVDVATSDGTATAGQDYLSSAGTLIFEPGETQQAFEVELVDDGLDEIDETVEVTLSNPVGASLATPQTALLTILDDDPEPTVQFSADSFTVSQAESQAIIEVSLSAASAKAVAVDYATSDGTASAGEHYLASQGTLDFGSGETVATFAVPLVEDLSTSGDLTVNLALLDPLNAGLGLPTQAVLTILAE